MKTLLGLDGKELKISLKPSSFPMRNETASKSKIQFACGQILKNKFPFSTILEEVRIPKHNLILDFYMPVEQIALEVNGRQHTEYVSFFHKDKHAFGQSQIRDAQKEEWCRINNITLLVVESPEELESIL